MRQILCLLCFVCTTILWGAFENLESFESAFTQEVRTLEGEKIVYTGKLYMKKPHFVRWDYLTPVPKELYSNGNEVVVFEPLLEQVTLIEVDKKILNFSKLLEKAKKNKEGKYSALIEGKEYFLDIDQKGIPQSITYKDEFDHQVLITLTHRKPNIPLADKIFIFIPPSSVDIIRHKP